MTPVLLGIVTAAAGILVGCILVYGGPRVVAYRLPAPPAQPSWMVMVPLIGGRLADWRPFRTAGIQVLLAALFVALSVRFGPSTRLILAMLYCGLLAAIAYVDLDYRLVLNRLSYPGIALALAASTLWPGFGLLNAFLGALTGLLVFGVLELVGRGALGTGDTKLAALIGAMLGLPGVLEALLLGVVLGGLGAAFFLVALRRGRKEYMAYAPYLAAGAVLSFFTLGR